MSRQFSEPQHHIFYDMGAGSTVASLVKFENERSTTKVTVLAVSYDKSLGGLTVDALLADHLATAFIDANKGKLQTPLLDNARARAKLLREAARIKVILSVNSDVQASIESLHEDRNLRLLVTRTQLEDMIAPLQTRVVDPLRSVLSSIPADQMNSLVLVGGGVRLPLFQRWLEAEVGGSDKVAMNVNGDEAAVLGATWRAAVVARAFRVQRDIQVQDGLPFSIDIGAKKTSTLFPTLAPMVAYKVKTPGVAKTVTIKKNEPLDLPLWVGGLDEAIASIHTKPVNESVIDQKLTFQLDSFGIISLKNATSTVLIAGSSGLLGIGKTEDSLEEIILEAQLVESLPSLSGEALTAAQDRLTDWDNRERSRRAREDARNALESLVYSAKEKTSDPDPMLFKVATKQELDEVAHVAVQVGDWLDEAEEDKMTVEVLDQRREELASKLESVVGRWDKVQNLLKEIRSGVKQLNESSTWADEFEDRDQYDLVEIEKYAKDVQKRVEDKTRQEYEEKVRKVTEKIKAEEEAKRKRDAEELLRKAAEEMSSKSLASVSTTVDSNTSEETIVPANGDQLPPMETGSSSIASSSTSTPESSDPHTPSNDEYDEEIDSSRDEL